MKNYFPNIKTQYGSVSMTLDMSRINGNFEKAQEYLGNQVLTDCTPYTPFQSGTLRNSGKVESGGEEVVWTSPYARYQYYGMKMIGPAPKQLTDIPLVQHAPGTLPYWFEEAKSACRDVWLATVKRIAGGG